MAYPAARPQNSGQRSTTCRAGSLPREAACKERPCRKPGNQESLAVLIDPDNTSAKHAQAIFEEIVKLGEANVRRICGDFSSGRLSGWNEAIKSLAILQHRQRSNLKGKNVSDIALVIDAMDLMSKHTLDEVVLESSDSDFTRLTQRLRDGGQEVYGFGERKGGRGVPQRLQPLQLCREPD